MVGAAMAERQLERLEADGATQQLVTEADADDRLLAEHASNGVADVVEGGGVAGAVGEEDQIRIRREHRLGGRSAGEQGQAAVALAKLADDAVLDPGVERDHVRAVAVELDCLLGADRAREVGAGHRGLRGDLRARVSLGDLGREQPPAHRAAIADVTNERARVDAADRRHAAGGEPVEPAALGIGVVLAVLRLAHDHGSCLDAIGLHRLGGDAVVAHQRIGEGDDLPGVAGIADGLLIAGHRGVEDDLAADLAAAGAEIALESGSVLQQHVALLARAHLTSACTCLKASASAPPRSSNRAISTLVINAPARSIFAIPISRLASVARADRIGRDVNLDVLVEQVEHGLVDADVGLDSTDDRLLALTEVETVGLDRGELGLLDRLGVRGNVARELLHGGPEPFRILLGDDDRDADRSRALHQRRGGIRDLLEVRQRLAKCLLDVDHDQRGPRRVELRGAHDATPESLEGAAS